LPGYACFLANGTAQCVMPTSIGDSSVIWEDGAFGPDAPLDVSVNETSTLDVAVGTDAHPDASDAGQPVACNGDSVCAGSGARCVNGECTPRSRLCSDATQCASNESCVDGLCIPRCDSSGACPPGFECDFTNSRGVCSYNPSACSVTADCHNGTVCVEAHCVPSCAAVLPDAGDSGAACGTGAVCVNGGCIPDQHATFTCTNNGNSGPLANSCNTDSICLHNDCYVACNPLDGGSCAGGGVCTAVTVTQGSASATFNVCGNGSNLGSQCDPATALLCPLGQICIDGYCK
jgi:hypothetical protein